MHSMQMALHGQCMNHLYFKKEISHVLLFSYTSPYTSDRKVLSLQMISSFILQCDVNVSLLEANQRHF